MKYKVIGSLTINATENQIKSIEKVLISNKPAWIPHKFFYLLEEPTLNRFVLRGVELEKDQLDNSFDTLKTILGLCDFNAEGELIFFPCEKRVNLINQEAFVIQVLDRVLNIMKSDLTKI